MTPPKRRMPAAQRRAQVLAAAVTAFAAGGYTGTTTDDVARHAGVSQPYVVRMFGTKQALFLAAHAESMRCIEDGFRAAVDDADASGPLTALGRSYRGLIGDRDLLRVMQHGFVAAADPALGPAMRARLLSVYRLVRELTGATAEEARDFLARGMLINTLVLLEIPEHLDESPDGAELLGHVLANEQGSGSGVGQGSGVGVSPAEATNGTLVG